MRHRLVDIQEGGSSYTHCKRCGSSYFGVAAERDNCEWPVQIRVQLVIQDVWLGVFWKHLAPGWDGGWWETWTFYVCLVPMLPVIVVVDRSARRTRAFRRWHRSTCSRGGDWCADHAPGWRR